MTKIVTKYLGDLRTEAEHLQSGNKILTDAPLDNQGKGEYFSATDLLATSLGSCILTIMGISAKNHGFSIDGAWIETEKVMSAQPPRRVAKLILDIHLPRNNYSEKEIKLIEAAVAHCPVGLSLHPDVEKQITLHYGT